MNDFYNSVLNVLKQDDRFFSENGELLRNAVYEAAMKMDSSLIKILFADEVTRAKFFTDIDGIAVFDKVGFGWVINNRDFLPDSYTRYKNKIGLVNSREDYISTSDDVELVFPYKDCILEGGQTKEEQKRNEIFYNKTLASDEVDRLLFPKVLTNAKKYGIDGVQNCTNFNENDNLIVKGNNLLALSSLLACYEGKIKCIYIDPPYYFNTNKDEDTFEYNSNFKLSTWLCFMKNRLEIAKKLLSKDGAIFVQISDDGVAELHRLLKDIFCSNGENNFINKITVKTKSPSGFASVNPGVFETAEYILAFAKNKKYWTYNAQYVKSEYDPNYKWYITNKEDDFSKWEIVDVFDFVAKKQGYNSKKEAVSALGKIGFDTIVGEFALRNSEKIFQSTAIGNNAGQEVVKARDASQQHREQVFSVKRNNHYDVYIYNGREMAFYNKKIREIDGELTPSMQLSNIWTDTPYEGIAKEGDVTLKGGKKPEKLIRRIIEMSTNPNDIVLDYHLGSGTTCAVAHKLGRKYIGIEQLDGQVGKILHRLTGVIEGDNSGISKSVNWQGGSSFVYCELKKLNQQYIEYIEKANNDEMLTSLLEEIIKTGFISHKVNPSEIDTNADDFKALSIDDKKQLLMELIDKNQLYVNYCDIDDETLGVSDEDKAFTKSFYGEV